MSSSSSPPNPRSAPRPGGGGASALRRCWVLAVALACCLGVSMPARPAAARVQSAPSAPTLRAAPDTLHEPSSPKTQPCQLYDPEQEDGDDPDADGEPVPGLPPGIYGSPPAEDPDGADSYEKELARARKRSVDGDLSSTLGDERYKYCKDLEYRVRAGDYHLCAFADGARARCPGFAAACAKPPLPAPEGGSLFGPGGDGERGPRSREDTKGSSEPSSSSSTPTPSVPAAMSGFAAVVFWVLVVCLVAALIFAIAKNMRRDSADEAAAEASPSDADSAPLPPRPRGPVETDVDRLLARAHAAANSGDFEQAMADAYAALLRYLDGNGLIELHHSRTNGEYARHLRKHPELQSALSASARELESVQFGANPPSPAAFKRLIARIMPVVSRAAVLLLVAWLTTQTMACGGASSAPKEAVPSTDHTPSGVSVLQSLLVKRGAEVRELSGSITKIPEDVDTLVVHGPLNPDDEEWRLVLAWVKRGGSLVVALDSRLPEAELGARRVGTRCDKLQVAAGYATYSDLKLVSADAEALEVVSGDHWSLLECRDAAGGQPQPYVVARALGRGNVVVMPSSDLISNAAMASDDHAFAILELVFGSPKVVVFVDTWTTIGEDSPFAAVANGKLNPFLIQLFVMMSVLFWWKGRHFARPRSPPGSQRRAFREHVEALGAQYAKARASRLALGMYASWAMDRLRERCQPGGRRGLMPLAAAISARTGRDERVVMRLLVECESARENYAAPGEPAEDLKMMRQLEALLAETGGIR